MKLIIRKSECKHAKNNVLVKSPKDAIRKTLNNYIVENGVIVRIYQPSYVSRDEAVLRGSNYSNDITITLLHNKPALSTGK